MPSADKPSILHPLCGANVRTAAHHWARNRPFPVRSLPIRGIAAALIALRFPNYTLEHLRLRKKLATYELADAPIFLIGHWRSGTTHLHNLLSQDPRFGHLTFIQAALPWDAMGKFKPARPIMSAVMPETRGMDDVRVSIDTPQEEEMALANMNPLSFFNCFYFPQQLIEHFREGVLLEGVSQEKKDNFTATYRYLVNKFSHVNAGKQLLLKNPANTARLALLKSQFPNAKFVHIVRNPFEVYASMQKLWSRLFSAFSLQAHQHIDTHQHTLEIYESLTKRHLSEKPAIPDDDFIELRFENLERDPVGQLAEVYDHFRLPGAPDALKKIQTYADSLAGYRRNSYTLPQPTIDQIGQRWGFALDHWDYQIPDTITPAS